MSAVLCEPPPPCSSHALPAGRCPCCFPLAVLLWLGPLVSRRCARCAATYFAFASIGVAAVVTINSIVPETKGKTLEEIEAMWQDK